jgi:hypothetical protein
MPVQGISTLGLSASRLKLAWSNSSNLWFAIAVGTHSRYTRGRTANTNLVLDDMRFDSVCTEPGALGAPTFPGWLGKASPAARQSHAGDRARLPVGQRRDGWDLLTHLTVGFCPLGTHFLTAPVEAETLETNR